MKLFLHIGLSISCLILTLVTGCTAVKPDPDVWSFFIKNFKSQETRGGCKTHRTELESSYKEAYKLVKAALDAIKYIEQNPRPKITKPKDRWRWNKTEREFHGYFGIPMNSNGGPIEEKRKEFGFVKSIFEMIEVGMRRGFAPGRTPALLCQDETVEKPQSTEEKAKNNEQASAGATDPVWRFYKRDEPAPQLEGKTLAETVKWPGGIAEMFSRGAWVSLVVTEPPRWLHPGGSNPPDEINMCLPARATAVTWAQADLIVWCDLGFEGHNRQHNVIDTGKVKKYTKLDEPFLATRSVTWVHELSHFYGAYLKYGMGVLDTTVATDVFYEHDDVFIVDKPAYNKQGNLIPNVKSYGVAFVLNLAKYDPSSARLNADSYAKFAAASYLSDWDWSMGFSQARSML